MSFHSRERKRRVRNFKSNYGDVDFQFHGWHIKQIHEIPDKIEENQEFDFWAKNRDVYLVTFENSIRNKIYYIRDNPRQNIHIRVCTSFSTLNKENLIRFFSIISQLGIPQNSIIRETRRFHTRKNEDL